MTFDDILDQILVLLRQQGRVSYWALKRRFDLRIGSLKHFSRERPTGAATTPRRRCRALRALSCPPARGDSPARAARSQAEHGAARLWLVLDRRRRMGEGSAAGVPWGDGLGQGGWERRGGERQTGLQTRRGVKHTSTARTSPPRPRAMA